MNKKLIIVFTYIFLFIASLFPSQNTNDQTVDNLVEKQQFITKKRKVVVLPFYNHSQIEEYKYLESTISDSLYAQLDTAGNFNIIRLPDDDKLHKKYNEKQAEMLAKDLSADVVVNGYFSINNDRVYIFMNAIDVDVNRSAIAVTKSGEVGIEIYSFVDELSKMMVVRMAKALPPRKSLIKRVTVIREKEIIKEIIKKDEYPLTRYNTLQKRINRGMGFVFMTLTLEFLTYLTGDIILYFNGSNLTEDWVYKTFMITKAVGVYGYIGSMLLSSYASAMYYYNFFSYYSVHPEEHAKKYKGIRNGLIAGSVVNTVLLSGSFILTLVALGLYKSFGYVAGDLTKFYSERVTPHNPLLFQLVSSGSLGLLPLTVMLTVIDIYLFIAAGINHAIYRKKSKKFIDAIGKNKVLPLPIVGISNDSSMSLGVSIRF